MYSGNFITFISTGSSVHWILINFIQDSVSLHCRLSLEDMWYVGWSLPWKKLPMTQDALCISNFRPCSCQKQVSLIAFLIKSSPYYPYVRFRNKTLICFNLYFLNTNIYSLVFHNLGRYMVREDNSHRWGND